MAQRPSAGTYVLSENSETSARREAERKKKKNRACKDIKETRAKLNKALREQKQVGAELRILQQRPALLESEKKTWNRHVCARGLSELTIQISQCA
jgi:hypothetical protein